MLGTDLVTVSVGTNLILIHISKTAIIEMKVTLTKKELRNEVIKYN